MSNFTHPLMATVSPLAIPSPSLHFMPLLQNSLSVQEVLRLRSARSARCRLSIAVLVVACVASFATSAAVAADQIHDCPGVKRNCGAWAPKDKNTCRTCKLAQCKTENGKEMLAGNKTQAECYEGHGPPP